MEWRGESLENSHRGESKYKTRPKPGAIYNAPIKFDDVALSGVRLGRRLKGARFPPASSRLGHALVHLSVDLRSEPRIDRLAPASSSAPDRTIGLRVGSE